MATSRHTRRVVLEANKTVNIVNYKWPRDVLDLLNAMRNEQKFCDVVLEVLMTDAVSNAETKFAFHAHACILAASSQLMQSILDPQPQLRCILLKSLSKPILSLCLDYMYGCGINIKYEQLQELCNASEILQIQTLNEQCKEALAKLESDKKHSTTVLSSEKTMSNITTQNTSSNFTPQKTSSNFTPQKTGITFTSQKTSSNFTPLKTDDFTPQNTSSDFTPQKTGNDFTSQKTSSIITPQNTSGNVTRQKSSDNFTPQESSDNFTPQESSDNFTPQESSDNFTPQKSSDNFETFMPDNALGSDQGDNEYLETSEIIEELNESLTTCQDNDYAPDKDSATNSSFQEVIKKFVSGSNTDKELLLIVKSDKNAPNQSETGEITSKSNVKLTEFQKKYIRVVPRGSYNQTTKRALCDHCGRTFKGINGLKRHRANIAENQDKIEKKKKREKAYDPTEEYLCNDCGDVIVGSKHISAHRAIHRRKKNSERVKCSHCSNTFAGEKGLKEHLERVAKNPNFRVHSFDKKVQREKKMEHHRKKRICKDCGKELDGWNNYWRHKKLVHDRNFVCQYCSKVFVTPKYLKCHEQRHTKEKEFFCSQCDFGAVSKFEVEEHMRRRHLDEKYCCTKCPAVYKSKLYLQRHEREYHKKGVKECPECDYRGTELNLRRHLLNMHFQHQRKVWSCEVCNKNFTQKGHHDRHLKQVHGITPTRLVPFSVNKAAIESSMKDKLPSPRKSSVSDDGNVARKRAAIRRRKKQPETEVVEEFPTEEFYVLSSDQAASNMYPLDNDSQIEETSEIHMDAPSFFVSHLQPR